MTIFLHVVGQMLYLLAMIIYFFLGMIFGSIVLTTCLTLVYIILCNNLPRAKQVVNRLQQIGKKKGAILEPENESVKNWVDSLTGG